MWWFLACARPRDPAPPELDRLLSLAFSGWEDPIAAEAHAEELAGWLAREGSSEAAWDGLQVANLSAEAVAAIPVPEGTDLDAHRGVATAFQSAHPATAHAALAVEADQRWTDPSSFERYDRDVVEGDPEAFAAGEGVLRTWNVIEKGGPFGVRIPYTLTKDYRWTRPGEHLLVRWWLDEPGCSDNGKNCVLQTFGVELLAERGEGAERLLANWIEVRTEVDGLLSEEAKIALIAQGNQDLMEATEEALEER